MGDRALVPNQGKRGVKRLCMPQNLLNKEDLGIKRQGGGGKTATNPSDVCPGAQPARNLGAANFSCDPFADCQFSKGNQQCFYPNVGKINVFFAAKRLIFMLNFYTESIFITFFGREGSIFLNFS